MSGSTWLVRRRVAPVVLLVAGLLLAGLSTAGPARAASPSPPISYTTFEGATLTLVPWKGSHVALLVPPDYPVAAAPMTSILGALDRAYEFYAATTGRTPDPYRRVDGLASIAVVPSTCGAGCGVLGATGIEIESAYFDILYVGVRDRDEFDQVLFYELGRNFWFYSPQLEYLPPQVDPVVTGYAVLMRLESMDAAGVTGGPYHGGTTIPWPTFVAMIRGIVATYESDLSKTWSSTLAQGLSPGDLGGTDFVASIMLRLADHYGGDAFLRRFFHAAATLPDATTTYGAVSNMVTAASQAACTDLSAVFYRRWSFPTATGVEAARTPAAATPLPAPVSCGATVFRLAGADRYATAAAISAHAFAPGVPVAYVATGQGYADALAGGPAAAHAGGPVLTVTRDAVPAVITAELTRLRPRRIVVLGGPGVVSETVRTALRAYTTGTVTRVAGADRYATAAAVARDAFTAPVPVAYLATGTGYADALAGGAAAAHQDGPLLLTTPSVLPGATATALTALRPARIVVLGGTGAVSDAVKTALAPYTTGSVSRIFGADRYATAAALARQVFGTARTAYLATGTNYPDALAGVPAASADTAPLLLAAGTCVTPATRQAWLSLAAERVGVLGGASVVSDDAAAFTTC